MFTIEVKKREKDETFSLWDVLENKDEKCRILHDCFGGTAEASFSWDDSQVFSELYIVCKRCEKKTRLSITRKRRQKILETAIDGVERKIKSGVRSIQKT